VPAGEGIDVAENKFDGPVTRDHLVDYISWAQENHPKAQCKGQRRT
jgi:hypothetical protein